MQSYSDQRGYFENALSDSITKRKKTSAAACRSTTSPSQAK